MGVKQDYPEAAKWFLRGAEQGLPEAQSSLGLCYLEGHGVPQDYAQAINYYQKAAERGYDVAKYNLACCYFDGLGVSQDYVEALKWLSLISAGQMSAQVPRAFELRRELLRLLSVEQRAEALRRAETVRKC